MADIDSYTKPQRLVSEISTSIPQNQPNPSKYYSHFLYKALIVLVFVLVLPLFPSQAPEFINQTILTRSWELLHLLFVGIAVSYGLFSRRNDEAEKENHSKFDNAQLYVSRFLQVSSVFDDEADSPSGSDENKVQTWSSQYYRGEPVVVVAQEGSVLDEQGGTSSRIGKKPLLLPVRSLKSRVSDPDDVELSNEPSGISGSLSRSSSNSGSKRFSINSNKTKNGEFRGLDPLDLEEKLEGDVVLPSPIPWRSRSGRMEMIEGEDGPPHYSLPPSMEELEFNRLESRSFRSQVSRSSRPNSTSSSPKQLSPSPSISSPKKLSPSPSLSSESQAKNVEDLVRKKSFHKSSPPPAPPLPPPISRKSMLMKSSSSLTNDEISSEKDLSRSGREGAKPRTQTDGSLMENSVRTVRVGEAVGGPKKAREIYEDGMNGKAEKKSKEVEAALTKKGGRKTVGFDQVSVSIDKLSRQSLPVMSKPNFSEGQKEERTEFADMVIMESDEDLEDKYDDAGGSLDNEEAASNGVSDGGPDVDKKADEFIAKFREQIRLQRIESIKRSSGQLRRNSLR